MEEGRVPSVNSFSDKVNNTITDFFNLDPDDQHKGQHALNLLLFKKGIVDGTYGQEVELYDFLLVNYYVIDEYLKILGLHLMVDDTYKLAWVDILSEEDGRAYSPFSVKAMSANHLILLAVLQKRFATKSSSESIDMDKDSTSVLVTEQDIIKDMYLYMGKYTNDEKQKYKDAISAIVLFKNELGLLRLVWENQALSDGSVGNVYRINPWIAVQYNAEKINSYLESVWTYYGVSEEESSEEETTEAEEVS